MSSDAERHYNRKVAKCNLLELFLGMKVLLQDNNTWGPVTVLNKVSDRSYNVGTLNGGTFLRNRRFLKEASSKLVFKKVSFVEDEEPRRDAQESELQKKDKQPLRRSVRIQRKPERLSHIEVHMLTCHVNIFVCK
ncbi:hypothetical protein CAPTEDRAFT_191060 [Capitella teleta]|uniref:Uncharacterized protein n=1 Tax=Capitella teleta TaxID=283909 RepID=R7UWM2_CAPTE|nr:hypothetical protein CAPTEDRAFT_191060 [Capitella teleta]|eukprot:ELU10694.1 hypothetical protein CAPTEDRAFT_191060 [Capitella teleta]